MVDGFSPGSFFWLVPLARWHAKGFKFAALKPFYERLYWIRRAFRAYVRHGPSHSPIAVPNFAGLPNFILENTVVLPFNDSSTVERVIEKKKKELAAVIIEPVARGFLPPDREFLKSLRTITEENDIVLIFDEIMTGFRLGLGGAQKHFGITPDIVALGKVVGGGLPIVIFAGKSEIMELTSPVRAKSPYDHVFQSGTFNGCQRS